MKNESNTKIILEKKHYTPEDAKRMVEDIFREDSDPQNIFDELAKNVIPKLIGGNSEEQEWAKNHIIGRSSEAVMKIGRAHV